MLVVVLGLLVGAAFLVWPFIRYPVATERAAAAHLDEVSVDRADYLGEDTSDKDAVSRLWIRRDSAEVEPLPTYDARPLRQDHPGRDSLSRSRFEDELGWLDLFDEDMPCGLTAYRVIQVNASTGVDLSAEDEWAVEASRSTLIRVVVACGGG
ncbi:hypothetical protein V6U81_19315 [Micromonospora sp. CPCC 205711]|uniref:hypothetical protein n=1 Tax=Micromonospora sp. CPCC 205547 TaxID=3122400 RepID=UPI002FF29939